MGIYDRDYYREEPKGLSGPQTVVSRLIILNVAVYFVDWAFFDSGLAEYLAVQAQTLTQPWEWWRLITYGFLHDQQSVWHIAFNMLGLWIFGHDIEMIYGKKEFLLIYLTSLVFSSVAWAGTELLMGGNPKIPCVGASGGVYAVMGLFALHYPNRTILFMMIVPLPALVAVGLMMVLGFFCPQENVAHAEHLGGALFAVLYYVSKRRLSSLVPSFRKPAARRPRLRIHEPAEADAELDRKLDAVLEKLYRQGEASLTADERRTLEDASRRAQKRRQ